MSQIFWTKQTFFDENGARLANGRIRFFALDDTTPVMVYADSTLETPLGSSVALTDAGWMKSAVYSETALSAHLDAFTGLDEFGVPQYRQVQVFEWLPESASVTPSGTVDVVDTVAQLRVAPIAERLLVMAYNALGDCPSRFYHWAAGSSAIDNGGTVIASSVDATGRWIWTPDGNDVDCRAFGFLKGAGASNSQLTTLLNVCETNGYTAVFTAGTYTLQTGGTLVTGARIRSEPGVHLACPSGTYALSVRNPMLSIVDTFASSGFKLTIDGPGWDQTFIPLTAFDNATVFGYAHGTGAYNLAIGTDGGFSTWTNSCQLASIVIAKDCQANIVVSGGAVVDVDHVDGLGVLAFMQKETFRFRELRTSNVSTRVSYALCNVSDVVHLDTAVTLHSGATVTAYVEASGIGTLNTTDATAGITGGYGGKANFILSAHGINVGYNSIRQDYFADPNGMVNSWNLSNGATGDVDMGGAVSTATVTRNGKFTNGTIAGATCANIWLDRMTVTGSSTSQYVTASQSTLGPMPNLVTSMLTDVVLGNSTYRCDRGSRWKNVSSASGGFQCIGGNANIENVSVAGALVAPDGSTKTLSDLSIIGGAFGYINFDASVMPSDGDAVATNVNVETKITAVSGGLNAVNGSTRRWAIEGHKNVRIVTNKLSTVGSCRGAVQSMGTIGLGQGYGYIPAPVFVLRYGIVAVGTKALDYCSAMVYSPSTTVAAFSGGSALNTPVSIMVNWACVTIAPNFVGTGVVVNVSWDVYPKS